MSFDFNSPETGQQTAVAEENVVRGLFFSLAAVVGGVILTVVIWRLGFIASITSFAIAAGAIWLYAQGAGTPPRKGIIPLVVVILVGVVLSFFSVIASDASDAYTELSKVGYNEQSRVTFVLDNMFRGEVLKEYGKDMAMFAVFAVLGIFGTMRRLFN